MRAKFRTLAPSILCAARLTTTLPVVGRNAGKALQGRGLLQTRESTSLVQRALLAGGGGPEIHCPRDTRGHQSRRSLPMPGCLPRRVVCAGSDRSAGAALAVTGLDGFGWHP